MNDILSSPDVIRYSLFLVVYILGRIDYLEIEHKKGLFLRTLNNKFIPIIYKKKQND